MKKLIQVFTLLSLVVIFTAVSASAQTEYGSEVEIPFAFNVKNRTYEAGKYIVKLSKLDSGTSVLTVSDTRLDRIQTVLAQRSGDPAVEDVKLVFSTVSGKKVLTHLITPSGGFALTGTKQQRQVAGSSRQENAESIGASELF